MILYFNQLQFINHLLSFIFKNYEFENIQGKND